MSTPDIPQAPRGARRGIQRWIRKHNTASNIIAFAALVAAIVALFVPFAIDSAAAGREKEAAAEQAASDEANLSEQLDQGESLDQIAAGVNSMMESLTGDNVVADASKPESACRSDGERFAAVWGPERPIYSDTSGPTYTLLNSVRDNPNIGDERSFYGIRDAASEELIWYSTMKMERDHTYRVRVLVRNDSTDQGAIANDTRIKVNLPTCTGTAIQTAAYVTSQDAFPITIYKGISLHSDEQFNLAYVEGSALVENDSDNSPFNINSTDFLTSTGQQIGFDELDGILRPGYAWAVYLSFEIQPQFAQ